MVQDSQQDRVEGTGCVGNTFSDILQLLYFIPEYPKLQAPLGVPAHVHVQEEGSVGRAGLNAKLILIGMYVRIACPYFRCELKVLDYCCLVYYPLKFT